MQQIAQHILDSAGNGENLVLVTVVRRAGSTPRGVGSQMLVSAAGLACGTIGGGTVERHAIDQAKQLVLTGETLLEDLSLSMSCGGDTSLLYSFISTESTAWISTFERIQNSFAKQEACHLVLQCPQNGQEQLSSGVALLDESMGFAAGNQELASAALAATSSAYLGKGFFFLPLVPPIRAIVFGAGHVAHAVVPALSSVGFACTVYDSRAELTTAERFPQAQSIICAPYENAVQTLPLKPRDYVLIMTHSHETDYVLIEQVLQHQVAYVGFMGSRKKIAAARKRCLDLGISEELLDTVHWPIGLDIKAETPAEIAISVAAECVLHRATQQ